MISFQTMMGQTPAHCAEFCEQCGSAVCDPASNSSVSANLQRPRAFDEDLDLSLLTDAELTARIELCANQMLAAHALGMKDERRRWYDEEAKALRERSRRPAMVAAMEAEIEARMAAGVAPL